MFAPPVAGQGPDKHRAGLRSAESEQVKQTAKHFTPEPLTDTTTRFLDCETHPDSEMFILFYMFVESKYICN